MEAEQEPVEEARGESAQSGADAIPKKEEPKSAKRKLLLKDDPKAEGHKPRRTSKRCLGRELMTKKGAGEASETVEVSSGEEEAPRDEKKSEPTVVGQEEKGSPTKPGENPPIAATESEAPKETEHPSPNPTDHEVMGSPTKPGESPVIQPSQPVQEAIVEAQQADPTAQGRPSTAEPEVSRNEDDEERY